MSSDPAELRPAPLLSSQGAFGRLVVRHGFALARWRSHFVEYRTGSVALSVELVPASEPSLTILQSQLEDLRGPPGPWSRHSQADIEKHLGEPGRADSELRRTLPGAVPARDPVAIDSAIGALACRWMACLERVDLHDQKLWTSLRTAKLNRLLALADDDAAGRAAEAFKAGEYERALALYARAPGPLKASDRKRLAIARRRAGLAERREGH